MGGFGMGKSGVMFPVPDVVNAGTYGGSKGWGMKKGNPDKPFKPEPAKTTANAAGEYAISIPLPGAFLPKFRAKKRSPEKTPKNGRKPKTVFLTKPLGSRARRW